MARAFDQVHSEAARLAGDEAMLRANLNAMFVNLSRRSQTLIERQLGIIESLEQTEQDASRLSSLFRLDHLATRMRRNSENLLVLAGHEAPRKWTQPVALVDVLRAAVSEIEQYERITLNVQSGLVIAGRAASDVVHLVAELVENATTFSRKDTQVFVTGQLPGQRRCAGRDHRRGPRHPRAGAGLRELAPRQPAGDRRRGVAADGPVRGGPPRGQARHQGPAAARAERGPVRADLGAGDGGGNRADVARRLAPALRHRAASRS